MLDIPVPGKGLSDGRGARRLMIGGSAGLTLAALAITGAKADDRESMAAAPFPSTGAPSSRPGIGDDRAMREERPVRFLGRLRHAGRRLRAIRDLGAGLQRLRLRPEKLAVHRPHAFDRPDREDE